MQTAVNVVFEMMNTGEVPTHSLIREKYRDMSELCNPSGAFCSTRPFESSESTCLLTYHRISMLVF